MKKRFAHRKKILAGIILSAAICLTAASYSAFGKTSEERGFTDFQHIQEEYLSSLDRLDWPEDVTLPDKLEGEDPDSTFQVGYGDTRASILWEYTWMKEWLDTYETEPEKAEAALEELEKAFALPYMGTDRCDDATRDYLRENLEKAKAGDPSGFQEATGTNLYH